jgi:hypothetical protein
LIETPNGHDGTALEAVAADINEADSIQEDLAQLEDTPAQRVSTPLGAWRYLDGQRSQVAYQLRVAREMGQEEQAKKLAQQKADLLKSLSHVFKDLLEALVSEPDVRNTPENWTSVPVNLRPILQKHLMARGIDVSAVLDQARQIEQQKQQA